MAINSSQRQFSASTTRQATSIYKTGKPAIVLQVVETQGSQTQIVQPAIAEGQFFPSGIE